MSLRARSERTSKHPAFGSDNAADSDRPRSHALMWVVAIGGSLGLVASWLFEWWWT